MVYYCYISNKEDDMATKKAASTTKKSTVKKSSPATSKPAVNKSSSTSTRTSTSVIPKLSIASSIPSNLARIVGAEILGTLILTLVALLTFQEVFPLYVGLTVALLVFSLGSISGGHFNPAVTFGLWAARRFKLVLVPFYWAGQILGALAAVALLNAFSNGNLNLDLSHFTLFSWKFFSLEVIGTAVFLLGLMAAINVKNISAITKGAGVGLSILVGLLVSGGLFSAIQSTHDWSTIQSFEEIPREYRIAGATLNPAVALASYERTNSQVQGSSATIDEDKFSRFGLDTILGTLIGAALGTNLYLLLAWKRSS